MKTRFPELLFRRASLLLMAILLWQCGPQPKEHNQVSQQTMPEFMIADTILYPVTIINPDSMDTWADKRLKRLDHETFTNQLFEALYNHSVTAYDYYSHKPVSAKAIKKMEASGALNRKDIAQLQFEESWFFDAKAGNLTKKVRAILLATPVYNDQEEVKGYKAAFVVKLNP